MSARTLQQNYNTLPKFKTVSAIGRPRPLAFPDLPHLNHLEFHVDSNLRLILSREWFDRISGCPALQAITLNVTCTAHYTRISLTPVEISQGDLAFLDTQANRQTLSDFDDLLCTALPATPRCIWNLVCNQRAQDTPYYAQLFSLFQATIETNMRQLWEQGMLEFRQSVLQSYADSLP